MQEGASQSDRGDTTALAWVGWEAFSEEVTFEQGPDWKPAVKTWGTGDTTSLNGMRQDEASREVSKVARAPAVPEAMVRAGTAMRPREVGAVGEPERRVTGTDFGFLMFFFFLFSPNAYTGSESIITIYLALV